MRGQRRELIDHGDGWHRPALKRRHRGLQILDESRAEHLREQGATVGGQVEVHDSPVTNRFEQVETRHGGRSRIEPPSDVRLGQDRKPVAYAR